ncbi:ParB/RepB/Spo0J family partition protein [Actinophytocola sp.]|uniref:ParB/RepB/Spo0J family partition protein n=1 Tax=Actinophytocola sp. TaxID=1872138 RepID=UPI002D3F2BDD|nr:ParB/RepB/Spo0J family partition protein [Actinophytocola sp.]HYQ70285.1 ParB/RepB/Spo0J family partition protein [Actinophytocola sp.]
MNEATVPIAALQPSDSPRLDGEDGAHVRLLAQSAEDLPPILVHRGTNRVIDGMHRLEAAALRGDETIRVQYFDGDDADAFVQAVRANVTHGLPLTMADRRAAAERIVGTYPQWSDRAIARTTGLSAKTVGGIRATAGHPRLRTRVGWDGRTRPLDCTEGRLRASALMREKPTASMRQIAAEADISLGTVRDVRDRLSRGDDPVPRQRGKRAEPFPVPPPDVVRPGPGPAQHTELLRQLKNDPSLRCSELGRTLIRLLSMTALDEPERRRLADTVPEHCRPIVADLACACANLWWDLATHWSAARPHPMRTEDRPAPRTASADAVVYGRFADQRQLPEGVGEQEAA